MISISHKAWYIRYTDTMCNTWPSNVCQLIRFFIGTTLAWAFIIMICSVIFFIMIQPLLYPFGVGDGFSLMAGLAFDGFVIAMFIRDFVDNGKLTHPIFTKNLLPTDVPDVTFFKLVKIWLKALHDKTCPLIKIS